MRLVMPTVVAVVLVLVGGCGDDPEARPAGGSDSTTARSDEKVAEEIVEALPRGVVVLLGDDAGHLTSYACTETVFRSGSRRTNHCEVEVGQTTRTFTHEKSAWAEE